MNRLVDLVSNPARQMGTAAASQRPSRDTARPLIRLDSNENPFGPSPGALESMQEALRDCHRYPDDDCLQLRNKLSDLHKLSPQHVLVTAGSTQMLALLCRTMLQPGRNAVTSERSFIVYKMLVQATGADLIEVPMREDRFDPAAILTAVNEDTRLVFLANPNNPTGTRLDSGAITQLVANIRKHVILVLDEAYYEFAAYFAKQRNVEGPCSLEYVRRGANVAVLRTFSKVHGLAGLRIGYGTGPAELLGYCAKMRNTFSVSSVAQAAALAAMDDHDHMTRTLANNAEQAEILAAGLAELGFRVVPTWANFLYCDLGRDATEFARGLRAEGVSVRPLGAWGAPGCIRVSIGTPEENTGFLNAARKVSPNRNSAPQE